MLVERAKQAVQNVAMRTNATARPRLSLLGGFQFSGGGANAQALGRKSRALIAYLALQSRQARSREQLAALLWGSHGETHARVNLRQSLMEIRKVFRLAGAPVLASPGEDVVLDLSGVEFDVVRFEASAQDGSPESLELAASLYRGDLLDGFAVREEAFEDWLRVERERLRGIWIGVLDKLVRHYEDTDASWCIRVATRLLAAEPLREDVHRVLIRAYAGQNRLTLALDQYERCRAELQRHLRIQPESETQELYLRIKAQRMAGSSRNLDQWGPEQQPQTRYVNVGGISIAYQVTGTGPVDIVYVPGWVSNLDHAWTSPRLAHVFNRIGTFARLIRMDKRGTGLSDRNTGTPTLEALVEDLRAVLDAVQSPRAVMFGSSEGGNMCMLFAAAHPDRTAALVLHGCSARGLQAPDYPWAKDSEQIEAELAEIQRNWGEPYDMSKAAPSLQKDLREREWFASYLRNSASPVDAVALWRWSTQIDVRAILPLITAPTLVLRTAGDQWSEAGEALYLESHIAEARRVELPGNDHVIWGSHCDRLLDEIERFVKERSVVEPCQEGVDQVK
jgi:DNA-binding SARP family transcriptional activator/pimeloyl-ACP methyl ester carboxylesterase